MDPQNNKFANVNMKYSDKAKKVFYNIKLGKSPDREEKTDKIIQSFNEEGILAEPITDGDGKAVPGAIRVIFSLLVNDRNDNNGYFTWNVYINQIFFIKICICYAEKNKIKIIVNFVR